jgi:hypothetical protein
MKDSADPSGKLQPQQRLQRSRSKPDPFHPYNRSTKSSRDSPQHSPATSPPLAVTSDSHLPVPESREFLDADDSSPARNKRRSDPGNVRGHYRCGRCGQPKRGHVCPKGEEGSEIVAAAVAAISGVSINTNDSLTATTTTTSSSSSTPTRPLASSAGSGQSDISTASPQQHASSPTVPYWPALPTNPVLNRSPHPGAHSSADALQHQPHPSSSYALNPDLNWSHEPPLHLQLSQQQQQQQHLQFAASSDFQTSDPFRQYIAATMRIRDLELLQERVHYEMQECTDIVTRLGPLIHQMSHPTSMRDGGGASSSSSVGGAAGNVYSHQPPQQSLPLQQPPQPYYHFSGEVHQAYSQQDHPHQLHQQYTQEQEYTQMQYQQYHQQPQQQEPQQQYSQPPPPPPQLHGIQHPFQTLQFTPYIHPHQSQRPSSTPLEPASPHSNTSALQSPSSHAAQ